MTKYKNNTICKEYYEAHREERKEYLKAYYKANKDKWKAHYQANKDEIKEHGKTYYQLHKNKWKEHYQLHKDKWKAHYQEQKAKYRAYHRAYSKSDTNSSGATKSSVRSRSSGYLFNTLKHTKLAGYEIHHCFGYEDYKCFIYIPKELHLQIHQYLRDNNISADSNHFSQIVHLINDWDDYTYIKV